MKGFHLSAAAAAFVVMFSSSAFALDKNDQKFTNQAAIANLAEIELAQLAQQQASADPVKQYAQHLQQEHQQATQQLKSLAQQKGAQLPSNIDDKHKREKDKLAKLQGGEFDKAFIDAMVKDHKKTINDFEKQAKDGKDAELKAFAAQALPKLREHLEHAQQLQSQLKGSGKQSDKQS